MLLRWMKHTFQDGPAFEKYRDAFIDENRVIFDIACEAVEKANAAAERMHTDVNRIDFTVVDLETTGFFPDLGDEVLSIGACRNEKQFYDTCSAFKPVPPFIEELTGLKQQQINLSPSFPEILTSYLSFQEGSVQAAYPASFDLPFLQELLKRWQMPPLLVPGLDILELSRKTADKPDHRLDKWVSDLKLSTRRHHALEDASAASTVLDYLFRQKRYHYLEEVPGYMAPGSY
ncbi:3'-5' exonuclease [Alkalicoccus urumqiensis]|uniref:Exonuclease domain-containing protein n=1 Tax=Alkalicoccus urumqiensis TaxID=1548213 RepID=A0A2P6MDT4_ALKUR|nr:exonuclease domain-containing protein [Alkalicoccus urumqiensis]PRO64430.1 hypothetical protein C6I21_14610 [Alkalicoccus urumqiensis]